MAQITPTPNSPNPISIMIRTYVNDLLWRIVDISIKSALILLLWNGFIASIFPLPILAFGNAFAIVTLVAILFGNLNGYSKFQTRHLFDLKTLVYQLIINQQSQNNSIMSLLARPPNTSGENEKSVPKTDEKVDGNKKSDYNTDELENKE